MKRVETRSLVPLQHCRKGLKLSTMLSEAPKLGACCARDNVDPLGFVLQHCKLKLPDRVKGATRRCFAALASV